MSLKSFTKFLVTFAASGCFLGGVSAIALAQSNSGLTIFSGIERENILNYKLDFGGQAGGFDRYRLRIPGKKMTQGATRFIITYPDYYEGTFDEDAIEVRIDGEPLPLREVVWDEENYLIEIDLEEPITESQKVELVFSNVRNPRFGGTFYFNAEVFAANDVPIRLYLGTWIVSIGRAD